MGYRPVVAQSFADDLSEIIGFYQRVGMSHGIAKLQKDLTEAQELLCQMPYINASLPVNTGGSVEYRRHLVGRYAMVYRVQGDSVVFLHLYHQSQNYEKYIFEK